ncbi:hypothetical protein CERSUDRAFT_60815 [Gelatoporia subvermispora B]|uniref:CxC1-like cysteine cluster associated with KDZ transposases domain-containing protein n=2 Tax=Ceriporiopsis subvermispora (strain B) TaxID=914234 RepID=M2QXY7_CERS8|nr:hypothetical protein CERSUDRAFT_60815 [Gelatoporia subvermispora B]
MAPSLRDQQPFVPGAGRLFHSPKKKRLNNVNKAVVRDTARSLEIQRLRKLLEELESQAEPSEAGESGSIASEDPRMPVDDPDPILTQPSLASDGPDAPDRPEGSNFEASDLPSELPDTLEPERKRRRTTHCADVSSMHSRWTILLPTIVEPLLRYLQRSSGKPVSTQFVPQHHCISPECAQRKQDVTILFWDHYEIFSVPYCHCTPLVHVLVTSGMFPTSPTQPRIAVSIDLLEFYFAIFERSGDAVTALARAMRNYYTRRGWRVLDDKVCQFRQYLYEHVANAISQGVPMLDPFRKPLGYAIQWYDSTRVLISRTIDGAIEAARLAVATHKDPNEVAPPPQPSLPLPNASEPSAIPSADQQPPPEPSSQMPPLLPPDACHDSTTGPRNTRCSSLLRSRCPACFGGSEWGRSLGKGGDIVVAVDGNFSHRHLRSSGEGLDFYKPEYFVPKEKVDSVGAQIEHLRKNGKKQTYTRKVPDEAVDACENGHEAANEQKAKTNGDRFDDTGVMALVCSHDIPIFLANIDTPGEQLKYAMCLVEELFANIPDDAVVAVLYDIGCVADRGNSLVRGRLVYNPRLRPGLGLRDGEGVERLWSRLRVFIPVTRTSGRMRRIWLLDRQARVIGEELRNNLGIFMVHKLKHGVNDQRAKARKILKGTSVPEDELRQQWTLQQAAQLSVRAHAPARLRKEVDAVLALQNDVDRVETAIEALRGQLTDGGPSSQANDILSKLEKTSQDLSKRVDNLYISLDVGAGFPELKELHANFVKILVLARDIKCNIRKRVTAQFLEYDRLDSAAGGKDNPLGTKLHQHTRKAISKRQPSILTAIRKFNKYCAMLAAEAQQHNVPSTFPLPLPLSTDLAKLRDDPNLYDDVWITPLPHEGRPRWLEEQSVRDGIQAMLKIDRCNEEESRLYREARNMCEWFGHELAATKLAMLTFESMCSYCSA